MVQIKLYVVNGKKGRGGGSGGGGWHLPSLFENPPVPDVLQPYFGTSGYVWDAPHTLGGGTGWGAAAFQTWMFESATGNEHAGTALGALASFGEFAAIHHLGEHFNKGEAVAFARGGRNGTWLVIATRLGSALIRFATGAPDTSGAVSTGGLRGPVDEIVAAIKRGDILTALKLPTLKGAKLKGLGAALDLNLSNIPGRLKSPFGRLRGRGANNGLGVGENALDYTGAERAAQSGLRFATGVL